MMGLGFNATSNFLARQVTRNKWKPDGLLFANVPILREEWFGTDQTLAFPIDMNVGLIDLLPVLDLRVQLLPEKKTLIHHPWGFILYSVSFYVCL